MKKHLFTLTFSALCFGFAQTATDASGLTDRRRMAVAVTDAVACLRLENMWRAAESDENIMRRIAAHGEYIGAVRATNKALHEKHPDLKAAFDELQEIKKDHTEEYAKYVHNQARIDALKGALIAQQERYEKLLAEKRYQLVREATAELALEDIE
ncbi:hypothetical protein FJ365_04830 [Candidatus Dependentiae bacterium]|nr:hypothetical protein [Candidatus Dependentiae bacterium]